MTNNRAMTLSFDFSAPIHGHDRLEAAWVRNAHAAMIDLAGELGLPGDYPQLLMRTSPPAVGLLHTSLILWAEQTSIGPECGIQYRRRGKLGGRTMFASLTLLAHPIALAERIITDLHLRTIPPLPDAQQMPTMENPGDI